MTWRNATRLHRRGNTSCVRLPPQKLQSFLTPFRRHPQQTRLLPYGHLSDVPPCELASRGNVGGPKPPLWCPYGGFCVWRAALGCSPDEHLERHVSGTGRGEGEAAANPERSVERASTPETAGATVLHGRLGGRGMCAAAALLYVVFCLNLLRVLRHLGI